MDWNGVRPLVCDCRHNVRIVAGRIGRGTHHSASPPLSQFSKHLWVVSSISMQRRRRNGDKTRPAVSIRSKLPHAESRVRRALLLWRVCAWWLDAQYALDAELRTNRVLYTHLAFATHSSDLPYPCAERQPTHLDGMLSCGCMLSILRTFATALFLISCICIRYGRHERFALRRGCRHPACRAVCATLQRG